MAIMTLKVMNEAGEWRRLYINGDAIAYLDWTDDVKIIRMKTGEIFKAEGQAGYWGDRQGHSEISLHQPE
jgi:hypothetical protein